MAHIKGPNAAQACIPSGPDRFPIRNLEYERNDRLLRPVSKIPQWPCPVFAAVARDGANAAR
jgi:hypothetical protein